MVKSFKFSKSHKKKGAFKDYYDVETILGRKIINNKKYYLIKWEGYSNEESTWEPISHLLNVRDMVEDFEKNQKKLVKSVGNDSDFDEEKSVGKAEAKEEKQEKIQKIQKNQENTETKEVKSGSKKLKKKHGKRRGVKGSSVSNVSKEYGKLIKVCQVQKSSKGELEAVVERVKDGVNEKIVVNCLELRKVNPHILLDYYEERINFYNNDE